MGSKNSRILVILFSTILLMVVYNNCGTFGTPSKSVLLSDSGNGEVFDGKPSGTYYDYEEEYQCTNSEGVVIDSYRNVISFDLSSYEGIPVELGDKCDQKFNILNNNQVDTSQILSGQIVYNNRVFKLGPFVELKVITNGMDLGRDASYSQDGKIISIASTAKAYLNPSQSSLPPTDYERASVITYSDEGQYLWSYQHSSNTRSKATEIKMDSNNNVYLLSRYSSSFDGLPFLGGNFDGLVTKLSPSGQVIWHRLIGSNQNDIPYSLAIDELRGYVYVAGVTGGTIGANNYSGGVDFFVVQLDSQSGQMNWARQKGTQGGDLAKSVRLLGDGKVLISGDVTGSIDGQFFSGGDFDAFVSVYNEDGSLAWTRLFGTNASDRAVTVEEFNGVYVLSGFTTGPSFGTFGGVDDWFHVAVDESGNVLWQIQSGQADTRERPSGSTQDGSGNIYVCGFMESTIDGAFQTRVRKMDMATGEILWDLEGSSLNLGMHIQTCRYDSVKERLIVIGNRNGPYSRSDISIMTIDADGKFIAL